MAEAELRAGKEEYVFEDVAYKPKCAVAMIDESPKLIVSPYMCPYIFSVPWP